MDVTSTSDAENPDEKKLSNLKNELHSICEQLSFFGEESMFLSVNLEDATPFFSGSRLGKAFLFEKSEVIGMFYEYCKLSYSSHESSTKSGKKQRSKSESESESSVLKNSSLNSNGDKDNSCKNDEYKVTKAAEKIDKREKYMKYQTRKRNSKSDKSKNSKTGSDIFIEEQSSNKSKHSKSGPDLCNEKQCADKNKCSKSGSHEEQTKHSRSGSHTSSEEQSPGRNKRSKSGSHVFTEDQRTDENKCSKSGSHTCIEEQTTDDSKCSKSGSNTCYKEQSEILQKRPSVDKEILPQRQKEKSLMDKKGKKSNNSVQSGGFQTSFQSYLEDKNKYSEISSSLYEPKPERNLKSGSELLSSVELKKTGSGHGDFDGFHKSFESYVAGGNTASLEDSKLNKSDKSNISPLDDQQKSKSNKSEPVNSVQIKKRPNSNTFEQIDISQRNLSQNHSKLNISKQAQKSPDEVSSKTNMADKLPQSAPSSEVICISDSEDDDDEDDKMHQEEDDVQITKVDVSPFSTYQQYQPGVERSPYCSQNTANVCQPSPSKIKKTEQANAGGISDILSSNREHQRFKITVDIEQEKIQTKTYEREQDCQSSHANADLKDCSVVLSKSKNIMNSPTVGSAKSTYSCGICSKMFENVNILRRHEQVCESEYESYDGKGTYRCKFCGMKVFNFDSLRIHLKLHKK